MQWDGTFTGVSLSSGCCHERERKRGNQLECQGLFTVVDSLKMTSFWTEPNWGDPRAHLPSARGDPRGLQFPSGRTNRTSSPVETLRLSGSLTFRSFNDWRINSKIFVGAFHFYDFLILFGAFFPSTSLLRAQKKKKSEFSLVCFCGYLYCLPGFLFFIFFYDSGAQCPGTRSQNNKNRMENFSHLLPHLLPSGFPVRGANA